MSVCVRVSAFAVFEDALQFLRNQVKKKSYPFLLLNSTIGSPGSVPLSLCSGSLWFIQVLSL